MALKSIEEEWKGFARAVFGSKSVSDFQYFEMKKAFFAGAFAAVQQIKEIGEDHVTEVQAATHIERIDRECWEYSREVMKKHAEKN